MRSLFVEHQAELPFDDATLRQIVYARKIEFIEKATDLADAVSSLYPVGRRVSVLRGAGSWQGTVEERVDSSSPLFLLIRHGKAGRIYSCKYNQVTPVTYGE